MLDADGEDARDPSNALLSRICDCSVRSAVLIAALLYGIVIVGRLACHRGDATFFITAGSLYYNPSLAPAKLSVRTRHGYDGQFYYRLALDPFTRKAVDYGIAIDNPPYRQQRILYPLLAHILALGGISWIPWTLIAVNYLAVCALAYNAARLARCFSMPAIFGLAIPFFPGVLMGLDRDLADPLEISLMVFALYLVHSRRIPLAAGMLALAVLARETAVLLAGALFVISGVRALRKHASWIESGLMMIPLVTYAGWQLRMVSTWGTIGVSAGCGTLDSIPFRSAVLSLLGAFASVARVDSLLTTASGLVLLVELLYIATMVSVAAAVSFRSAASPGVKLAWALYLVLAAFLSTLVWVEDWGFMRGCAELMALGFIMVIGAREERPALMVLAPTLAIWMKVAIQSLIAQ